MVTFLPGRLKRWIPRPLAHRLKRVYYPWMLRRFRPEQWENAEAVRKLLSPGELVVDAGANIGYVTMLLARWVGPKGRVVSLEPVPATYDLLCRNLRSLRLGHVQPCNAALSNREGEAWMEVPSYARGGDNLYESYLVEEGAARSSGRTTRVHVTTLDSLLASRTQPVSFVKFDVEGHEEEAVRGAEQILRADRPALMIEVQGDPDDPESSGGRLVTFLESMGYKAYLYEKDRFTPRRKGCSSVDIFFLCARHLVGST